MALSACAHAATQLQILNSTILADQRVQIARSYTVSAQPCRRLRLRVSEEVLVWAVYTDLRLYPHGSVLPISAMTDSPRASTYQRAAVTRQSAIYPTTRSVQPCARGAGVAK